MTEAGRAANTSFGGGPVSATPCARPIAMSIVYQDVVRCLPLRDHGYVQVARTLDVVAESSGAEQVNADHGVSEQGIDALDKLSEIAPNRCW